MIDLSDGVAADARHVARASGVRVALDAAAVPVAPGASRGRSPAEALDLALRGGEDYELLLAVREPPENLEAALRAAVGVALTRVGSVESGEGAILRSPDGSETPLVGGFGHWAAGSATPPE